MLPDFPPESRPGRKLRKLLRLYDEHAARTYAEQEASGLRPLILEERRLKEELKAAAREAHAMASHRPADVALQAASLLLAELSRGRCDEWGRRASEAVLALLEEETSEP